MRETLFNWLQNDIIGARCLDLFAGSGALGLEALSRGAARTVLVEKANTAVQQLQANLHMLQCDDAVVIHLSAEQFLERGPGDARYNVVFLDPPFGQGLVTSCAEQLEAGGWLAPGALIYLETETAHEDSLPGPWKTLRDKTMGQVRSRLLRRES